MAVALDAETRQQLIETVRHSYLEVAPWRLMPKPVRN